MAKIGNDTSYPEKPSPLNGADTLIGTDSQDSDNTRQFALSDIASFVIDDNGVIISVTGINGVKVTTTDGAVLVGLENLELTPPFTLQPGTYQNATVVVDEYGRVTSAANGALSAGVDDLNTFQGSVSIVGGTDINVTNAAGVITIDNTAPGGGSVTSITAGTGLDGGTITTSGTIDMADTAVTPGTYTAATITVDQQGRITNASNSGATADQGLASVLAVGDTATNENIVLTGTSAISVPTGTLIVQTANLTGLATINQAVVQDYIQIQHELQDSSGATGTYGQILISDPTYNGGAGGVLWVDQPVLSTRVSLNAAQINSLTSTTGISLIPSQGVGNSIQVIGAAFSYTFGTTAYAFTNDLGLYTNLPSLATSQYTIPAAVINSPSSEFKNMNVTTNGDLDPNQPLSIYASAGANLDPAADGTVNIEITYKVVAI